MDIRGHFVHCDRVYQPDTLHCQHPTDRWTEHQQIIQSHIPSSISGHVTQSEDVLADHRHNSSHRKPLPWTLIQPFPSYNPLQRNGISLPSDQGGFPGGADQTRPLHPPPESHPHPHQHCPHPHRLQENPVLGQQTQHRGRVGRYVAVPHSFHTVHCGPDGGILHSGPGLVGSGGVFSPLHSLLVQPSCLLLEQPEI